MTTRVTTDPCRARLYRLIFLLAAARNLAFAAWAGFWPLSFFDLFDMDPPRYPAIWSCLMESVQAVAFPRLWPTLRDTDFWVDSRGPAPGLVPHDRHVELPRLIGLMRENGIEVETS